MDFMHFKSLTGRAIHSRPILNRQHHGLAARWYPQWTADLDDALACLPESSGCPHELFRMLATNSTDDRKQIALIHENGMPVAIAALRRDERAHWVPVTHYIVPGDAFPAKPGRLIDAAESLGIPVDFAFWRTGQVSLGQHESIRQARWTAAHGMDCTQDFEAYWRKTRKWHDIRKAREKCSAFPVGINEPGAARWVTAAWARKWGIASGELSDRILAAEYLQSIGRLVSTTLSDNGRWIGGTTNLIHDNELVAQVIFRDPDYDRYGIGTYLIYLAFEFAKKSGLSGFDMGGGLDYKGKYSPEKGQRCEVTICKGYANYQWYRVKMKVGLERILAKRQRGGPASYATIKSAHKLVAERQSENDESLAGDNHHENLPVTAT